MAPGDAEVTGIVLAAGAGRRFGRPKALVDGWLEDRVGAMVGGGCRSVVVVLGAAVEQVERLVPPGTVVVMADDWPQGIGASLQAGLRAVRGSAADAALVALVDVPGLTAEVVSRVVRSSARAPRAALAQAAYGGVAGHPVLLGRNHWDGVLAVAHGNRGARDYLTGRDVTSVECGDVGDGRDVDTPEDLQRYGAAHPPSPEQGRRGATCAR